MSISYRVSDQLSQIKGECQPEGMYFVLEKTADNYEMSKPIVDNESIYDISDSEYAISGRNYHRQDITDNVYSQSVDNTYDSSCHAQKDNIDHRSRSILSTPGVDS